MSVSNAMLAANAAEQAALRTLTKVFEGLRNGDFAVTPWMNSKRAAAYIGVSHHHLAKMREQRRGPPCRKNGKAVVYERGEVDAWLHALPRR